VLAGLFLLRGVEPGRKGRLGSRWFHKQENAASAQQLKDVAKKMSPKSAAASATLHQYRVLTATTTS